nr:hypothetical protein [Candidatus Coxiella mudrowiae]
MILISPIEVNVNQNFSLNSRKKSVRNRLGTIASCNRFLQEWSLSVDHVSTNSLIFKIHQQYIPLERRKWWELQKTKYAFAPPYPVKYKVFFHDTTRQKAEELELTGLIKNLSN